MKSRLEWLYIGSIGLILLGIARGTGGIILLSQGSTTLDTITATPQTVAVIGWGLVIIGLMALMAGIGILRKNRLALWIGIVTLTLFVSDGIMNGFLLFGRPSTGGTIVNIAVAGLLFLSLWNGREALQI